MMILPINYAQASPGKRKAAREQYVKLQCGLCYYCKTPLSKKPPSSITSKRIRWQAFPPAFLRHPIHLHHSHATNMTLGAVHAYCNAVLWQYHGE